MSRVVAANASGNRREALVSLLLEQWSFAFVTFVGQPTRSRSGVGMHAHGFATRLRDFREALAIHAPCPAMSGYPKRGRYTQGAGRDQGFSNQPPSRASVGAMRQRARREHQAVFFNTDSAGALQIGTDGLQAFSCINGAHGLGIPDGPAAAAGPAGPAGPTGVLPYSGAQGSYPPAQQPCLFPKPGDLIVCQVKPKGAGRKGSCNWEACWWSPATAQALEFLRVMVQGTRIGMQQLRMKLRFRGDDTLWVLERLVSRNDTRLVLELVQHELQAIDDSPGRHRAVVDMLGSTPGLTSSPQSAAPSVVLAAVCRGARFTWDGTPDAPPTWNEFLQRVAMLLEDEALCQVAAQVDHLFTEAQQAQQAQQAQSWQMADQRGPPRPTRWDADHAPLAEYPSQPPPPLMLASASASAPAYPNTFAQADPMPGSWGVAPAATGAGGHTPVYLAESPPRGPPPSTGNAEYDPLTPGWAPPSTGNAEYDPLTPGRAPPSTGNAEYDPFAQGPPLSQGLELP